MKALTAVLVGAASAFAVLPGVAAIAAGIGAPHGEGDFFGAAALVVGTLVLLFGYLGRSRIRGWRTRRVAVLAGLGLLAALSLFVGYRALLGTSEVVYDDLRTKPPETVVIQFPLYASGDLDTMISTAKGRREALDMYGRRVVQEEIAKPYLAGARAVTTAALMALFALTIGSLVFSLSIAGWKAADIEAGDV